MFPKTVSLKTDREGFLSQECPSCKHRFKVKPNEGAKGPISHCPYCMFDGRDCWWTPKQAEHLSARAMDLLSKDLEEPFKRIAGRSKFIKVEMKRTPRFTPQCPNEPDENWPVIEFPSGEVIKYDGRFRVLRCPVTGEKLKEEPSN